MNVIGFRTLLVKETRRFLKVPGQTLAQPVITTTLYFLVFGFALGGRVREVDGVSYVRFIVPGLVMLSLIQNAFLNTSSSMFIAKMQGTIVDLLVAPLSPSELLGAFTLAAVGARRARRRHRLAGGGGSSPASRSRTRAWVLAFALLVAAEFALFGLVGRHLERQVRAAQPRAHVRDHAADLPGRRLLLARACCPSRGPRSPGSTRSSTWSKGCATACSGRSDVSPWLGLGLTVALTAGSGALVWLMLARGYKLRA